MNRLELVRHWHARLLEYIILHADNIDALSIIIMLRHGTTAAETTNVHTRWIQALNTVKATLKNGTLMPHLVFNLIANIMDNPSIPQQHHWPQHATTVMETIINNLQFNSILSYTLGWPSQYTDHAEALVAGEAKGKSQQSR